ncbi:MAG: hypothetical protein H7X95_10295 [Deltaproteobacteria bacterium]|nr:hypothetical protein [Deltaproteobacteria bacterium]
MNRPVSDGRVSVAARLRTVGVIAGLALLPALMGCPGTLGAGPWDGTGGVGPTGSGGSGIPGTGGGMGTGGMMAACDDVPTVMMTSCAGAACHPIFGDFAKPDMLASRLINQNVQFNPACGQTKLINPGKPVTGALIDKLTNDSCGARMPPPPPGNPNPALPANFVECLKAWLEPQL